MKVRKESAASLLELCRIHSAAITYTELGVLSRPCCASQIRSTEDFALDTFANPY